MVESFFSIPGSGGGGGGGGGNTADATGDCDKPDGAATEETDFWGEAPCKNYRQENLRSTFSEISKN